MDALRIERPSGLVWLALEEPASSAQGAGQSDEALMLRSGQGDHAAFAELVVRHERWARSHARRIVGDECEAEDLAQEAFLRIWRAAPRWRAEAAFRSYLKVVLGNLCIDHLRRNRPDPVESIEDRADPSPGPLQVVADTQAAERLAMLIEALPPSQRMAILLVHGDGHRQAEAAEMMGLKFKAFESLLHRARVALRKGWNRSEP